MKKTFIYSAIFCFLILIQSCKKESPVEQQVVNQVINATVGAGQTYSFSPASSGTLSVSQQALHYNISEVQAAKDNGNVSSYKYTPAAGYTGADEVALTLMNTYITSSSGGCNGGNQNNYSSTTKTLYIIKINVTN